MTAAKLHKAQLTALRYTFGRVLVTERGIYVRDYDGRMRDVRRAVDDIHDTELDPVSDLGEFAIMHVLRRHDAQWFIEPTAN